MATNSTAAAAVRAYRNALRATKVAFRQDIPMLASARSQIRQGFQQHSDLTDTTQIEEEIQKLNDVSKFLIQNIVQGEKKEDGKYLLNFHERTELGDNETIKQSKNEMGSLSGAKAKKRSDLK
ncbi:mitochondrial zinc maintenance protein 1, mitochondrial [Scheffersomyces xylosifermentans]|uniref:mitochondrial zinc maintenance protein 1, mitochondrial n=1 Tax=Scheffersomyces xylosifermentans TaxID=1304137 RepID=UPI00315CB0DC